MNILITNIWLHSHAGTEVYVRDLSCALHNKGFHVEVYSPLLGPVADEIKEAGIHCVDDPQELIATPDIIHAHHFIPTMEAIERFPEAPVIYFLHDRTHLIDSPPKYVRIVKYIAVDHNCLDRLIIDNGIEKEKTDVLFNWVDTERFKLRKGFSNKPIKALVFSNYASNNNYFKVIQEACAKKGIELDGIGNGFGNSINNPEQVLPKYDIVFAKAKAAMEAMASGAAVILCDFRGLGEMVSLDNFDYFRKFNFGMKTLTRSIDVNLIIDEIEKYNPEEIKKTALKIRNEASFDGFIKKIILLYQTTIKDDLLNKKWINTDYKRILSDYQHLKKELVSNKINKCKEELITKDESLKKRDNIIEDQRIEIQNHENKIKELTENHNKLKETWNYKLGDFIKNTFKFTNKK